MGKNIMFLLGYLTQDQWRDAIDGASGLTKSSMVAIMEQVEKHYGTKFDLGSRLEKSLNR